MIRGIVGEKMDLEGQNNFKICNLKAKNGAFAQKRAIITHQNPIETQYKCFLLELDPLETKKSDLNI